MLLEIFTKFILPYIKTTTSEVNHELGFIDAVPEFNLTELREQLDLLKNFTTRKRSSILVTSVDKVNGKITEAKWNYPNYKITLRK